MKIKDRLWLKLNKKPQRPIQSYLRIVFLWALYGWLIGLGMFFLVIVPERWYIGTSVIAFCLAMMFWFYWSDRRGGYVDVLHQRWLVKWLAHKKRIEDEK